MNKIKNIKNRVSVRSFSNEKIDNELLKKVQLAVDKKRVGPFGNSISFMVINTEDDKISEIGKMTSYGFIKGATLYIGGYCAPNDNSIIDYGYCFEELILELTSLNISTCWLGGTFGRSFISKVMNLPEGNVIPGISPIGFKSINRSFTDKLVRTFAKADKRKPHSELFFNFNQVEGLNPINIECEKKDISTLLEMLRIAPSASNRQPWRVIADENRLNLFWEEDVRYNSMIKTHNIQAIDMGIALCHLNHTAGDLGLNSSIEFNNPNYKDINWNYIASLDLKE